MHAEMMQMKNYKQRLIVDALVKAGGKYALDAYVSTSPQPNAIVMYDGKIHNLQRRKRQCIFSLDAYIPCVIMYDQDKCGWMYMNDAAYFEKCNKREYLSRTDFNAFEFIMDISAGSDLLLRIVGHWAILKKDFNTGEATITYGWPYWMDIRKKYSNL